MKNSLLTLLTIGVVVASVGAYYKWRTTNDTVEVSTAPVVRGDVVSTVGATGALEAVTTVQVGTQVSGIIKELNVDFNSIVRRGQVIARLDPSLFETQIEQARANLVRSQADVERLRVTVEDAKTKLTRAEELSSRNLIPRSELESAQVAVKAADAQLRSAQAQVTQAQASLNQNQVNLEHTVISAPIDGIVISRSVDVGQTVAASLSSPTLFIIAADLTKMKVSASVDEADVGRIRPAQHVRFRVDAYPTEEFTGTVLQVRLQPVVVQNVVTYATVIDVPNPELKLKPGMTANVTIEVARRGDVVKVPNSALRFRPTNEIFAALKQTPPTEGGDMWRGGGGQRRGDSQQGGGGRGNGRSNAPSGGGGRPTGTTGE
ncbi:MAG: efflux RND transporter periplasmic adaptor subunit, partial [Acidobacteria bacterium]|nr:efflux RND transporter periplasmic adaptor subunit [Acidobacteriota bacterium]